MYYLIEIAQEVGKEKPSPAVYTYTDKDSALGTFHTKLGSQMKNKTYTSQILVVIDQLGNTIAKECYVAPVTSEAITEE